MLRPLEVWLEGGLEFGKRLTSVHADLFQGRNHFLRVNIIGISWPTFFEVRGSGKEDLRLFDVGYEVAERPVCIRNPVALSLHGLQNFECLSNVLSDTPKVLWGVVLLEGFNVHEIDSFICFVVEGMRGVMTLSPPDTLDVQLTYPERQKRDCQRDKGGQCRCVVGKGAGCKPVTADPAWKNQCTTAKSENSSSTQYCSEADQSGGATWVDGGWTNSHGCLRWYDHPLWSNPVGLSTQIVLAAALALLVQLPTTDPRRWQASHF